MAYAGRQPITGFRSTPTKDSFNGDNSTVAFTLSLDTRTNDVEVFVENVQQEPVTAYSISGNTLTFTSAPPTGTGNIYVIHRAELVSNGVHTPGANLDAGVTTLDSLTVTGSADINGGTIDGVTIGGASAGAGTFTTVTGSGDMNIDSGTLFVDASENRVGIGTTSPDSDIEIVNADSGGDFPTLKLTGNQSDNSAEKSGQIIFEKSTNASVQSIIESVGATGGTHNSNLVFKTSASAAAGATERMRIDSSGNLLVGTTQPLTDAVVQAGGVGIDLRGSADLVKISRSGDTALFLNRNTSDGEILQFQKSGSGVGSIRSLSGTGISLVSTTGSAQWGSSDAGLNANGAGNYILPWNVGSNTSNDAAIDLGASTHRFKNLYLSGGVYLGGTGAANKLDDYEEGTWTPTFNNFTVGNGSVFGTYTKIGNTVHCWYGLVFGTTSSFTGTVTNITGLPFTILSRTGDIYVKSNGVAWDTGNNWTSMMAMGADNSTGTQYPMRTSNSAALTATSPFTWANQDTLTFQITYETAS